MHTNSQENLYISCLHSIGLSQRELKNLILEKNFSAEEIFTKIKNNSREISIFFGEKRFEKIKNNISKFSEQKHFSYIQSKNIHLYSLLDADFPEKIRRIHQVPCILYTLGSINTIGKSIGIVGSRKHTKYGEQALEKIISEIPENSISIISGGAYGIDSLAHKQAIKNNFHTIAVFGCGIDVVYPKTNAGLFQEILENNGGLISTFPLGTQPETYNFPIRNEIVAGLSDVILIPEAGIKSGTLITARLGLDLGKDIFAVPGSIFSENSQGCNMLINQGEAQCTLSAYDIFPEYYQEMENSKISEKISEHSNKIFQSEISEKIFNAISSGNNTIDSISLVVPNSVEEISMELTLLELSGYITAQRPGFYQCNS